jgi:hypothetical protein
MIASWWLLLLVTWWKRRIERSCASHSRRRPVSGKWEIDVTDLGTGKKLEGTWAKKDSRAVPLSLRRIWSNGGTLYWQKRQNPVIGMEEGADSLQCTFEQHIKVQIG